MADLRKAALEIDRLKGEVAELKGKIKRREERITYLDTKRSTLEKEVRAISCPVKKNLAVVE